MANDVDITIGAVDKSAEGIRSTSNNLSKLQQAAKTAGVDIDKLGRAAIQEGIDFRNTGKAIDNWIGKLRATTPAQIEFARRADEITKAFEDGKIGAQQAADSLEKLRNEMPRVSDETEKAAKKTTTFRETWVQLSIGVNQALELINKGIEAFKKGYQFGKEGAQLDYLRTKFDNLSVAVNTTSEALLVKLRKATSNMRTDADLVESAGGLMGLGLAKTTDEVVRLTRVAGALNMDMNQLTLTLTNQTTARFDQLGVSVDGFKERVAALKKAGLDTNAAFKEAFLQQAESQIKKVGDAANSGAAAFDRLEVSVNNVATAFKQDAAPAAVRAAEILNSVAKAVTSWDEATVEAEKHLGKFLASNKTLTALYAFGLIRIEEITEARSHEGQQIRVVADRYIELKNAVSGVTTSTSDATDASKGLGAAMESAFSGITGVIENARQAAIDYETELRTGIVDAIKGVRDAEAGWQKGAGGDVAKALEENGIKGENYSEALKIIDQVMGTSLLSQENYNKQLETMAKNYDPTKPDEFKQALMDLKDQYMPFAEEVQKANDKLWFMRLQMDWLQQHNEVNLRVTYTEEGPVQGASKAAPGGPSGPVSTPSVPQKYQGPVKKDAAGGAYIIPPGYNENYPVGGNHYASSGETVTVTPKGAAPGMVIQSLTLILPGVTNVEQFQVALGRLARKARVSGAGSAGRF